MEHFGRRKPLIVGGLWQSLWLFVFAAAGTAKDPATSKGIGNLMIVSVRAVPLVFSFSSFLLSLRMLALMMMMIFFFVCV